MNINSINNENTISFNPKETVKAENDRLRQLVQSFGNKKISWQEVAQEMHNGWSWRTCHMRWNKLNVEERIWSPAIVQRLEQLIRYSHELDENRWFQISDDIRLHFNVTINRWDCEKYFHEHYIRRRSKNISNQTKKRFHDAALTTLNINPVKMPKQMPGDISQGKKTIIID